MSDVFSLNGSLYFKLNQNFKFADGIAITEFLNKNMKNGHRQEYLAELIYVL